MKYGSIVTSFVLLLVSTGLVAQDRSTTTGAVENAEATGDRLQNDIRATSAMLKETRGEVDQRLAGVDKQLALATTESRTQLTSDRDGLMEAQSNLDLMLDLVNTAMPENWNNVKTKAEAVNTMTIETLTKMK